MGTKAHLNRIVVLGFLVIAAVLAADAGAGEWGCVKLAMAGDSLGQENAKVHGDPQRVAGQIDGALKLDGDGDYLELAPIPGLTSEQTKVLWLCLDSMSPGRETYIIDEGGNNNWIELVGIDIDGSPHVRAGFDGDNYIDSRARIKPGYWYHIAVVTRSSGEIAIYVDGQLDRGVPGRRHVELDVLRGAEDRE